MNATLDRFGRIVIPKEVRDDLGLEPGAMLQVEEVGDAIRLQPLRESSPLRRKDGVTVFAGKAVGDLVDALRRQRSGRLRQVSPRRRR